VYDSGVGCPQSRSESWTMQYTVKSAKIVKWCVRRSMEGGNSMNRLKYCVLTLLGIKMSEKTKNNGKFLF
jgi:hypothetical protein